MDKNRYEKMADELAEKIERVNTIINDCEELRLQWEQRIKEAEDAKETYDTLINLLRKQIE